jgi:hypothetical protein
MQRDSVGTTDDQRTGAALFAKIVIAGKDLAYVYLATIEALRQIRMQPLRDCP